ncbi:MAG: 3-isopropylmalate dehydratase small subunit [Candidatus Latescibacteria bacterium]|nr:3-isopropylmalate dehydratase small subunit [Candidatus Latescibacterota bacterium]
MRGYAHVYGRAHINTDEIIPARYLNTDDEAELANHAMEDLDSEFVKRVKPGDFIVAGDDFGCGSSREHAIWSLRGAGIKAVLANTFARIFFRNAVNNGFLAIECKGIADRVSDGDELEIQLKEGVIRNRTKNEEVAFTPIADFALGIMEAGGLLDYIKEDR